MEIIFHYAIKRSNRLLKTALHRKDNTFRPSYSEVAERFNQILGKKRGKKLGTDIYAKESSSWNHLSGMLFCKLADNFIPSVL